MTTMTNKSTLKFIEEEELHPSIKKNMINKNFALLTVFIR